MSKISRSCQGQSTNRIRVIECAKDSRIIPIMRVSDIKPIARSSMEKMAFIYTYVLHVLPVAVILAHIR